MIERMRAFKAIHTILWELHVLSTTLGIGIQRAGEALLMEARRHLGSLCPKGRNLATCLRRAYNGTLKPRDIALCPYWCVVKRLMRSRPVAQPPIAIEVTEGGGTEYSDVLRLAREARQDREQ